MNESLFGPNESFQENIVSLSQGNPGAVTALTELVNANPAEAALVMEDLDKMNIYGPRIWIGFSDYCDEDAEAFAESVLDQDSEMVEMINERRGDDDSPVETLY